MKVSNVKFLKRIQTAQYEHEEVELTAVVGENESHLDVLKQLKADAFNVLGCDVQIVGPDNSELVKVQLSKPGEPKATAQMSKTTSYPKSEEETSAVEGKVPPVIKEEGSKSGKSQRAAKRTDKSDESGVQSDKSETSSPVEEKKVEEKTAQAKGTVVFDNSKKEHRVRLATYLNENFAKWKTAPKEDIAKFSTDMNGKAFEDSKANLLPEFTSEVTKAFGKYK